jgi:hypothetical protein
MIIRLLTPNLIAHPLLYSIGNLFPRKRLAACCPQRSLEKYSNQFHETLINGQLHTSYPVIQSQILPLLMYAPAVRVIVILLNNA